MIQSVTKTLRLPLAAARLSFLMVQTISKASHTFPATHSTVLSFSLTLLVSIPFAAAVHAWPVAHAGVAAGVDVFDCGGVWEGMLGLRYMDGMEIDCTSRGCYQGLRA